MEKDLISIIIPIYNVEKYLKKCLDSIVNQTYKNIEIILVNDGSTDRSGEICDIYSNITDKIITIHQKNQGASIARNIGINKAKGKYITFVDGDDEVGNNYISYLYSLIKKNNTKMSIAAYTIISETGKKINLGKNFDEVIIDTETCLDRLLKEKGFTVSPCAKMYDKVLFENIKFPEGKLFEDNGTIYKLIMQCDKIAYGNESYYYYCRRDTSSTRSKFNLKKLELIELTDKMCDEIERSYPNLKNTLDKKRITVRFSILRMMNLREEKEINEKRVEIENYIKERKKQIMKNECMDKRDKMALISLMLGRRFFYFAWNIYCKVKY